MAFQKYLVVFALCVLGSNAEMTSIEINVNYTVSYEVVGEDANFEITARTSGWVALGLNYESASMFGTDYFVGWVNANNLTVGHGEDRWVPANATGARRPVKDAKQNWSVKSGSEVPRNGTEPATTKISFGRKLNTGDADQDVIIKDGVVHLLWAYHPSSDNFETDMHINTTRGWHDVNLFSGASSLAIGISTIIISLGVAIFKNF